MHCCIPTPTTDSNTSTGMIWVTLNMPSAVEECREPSGNITLSGEWSPWIKQDKSITFLVEAKQNWSCQHYSTSNTRDGKPRCIAGCCQLAKLTAWSYTLMACLHWNFLATVFHNVAALTSRRLLPDEMTMIQRKNSIDRHNKNQATTYLFTHYSRTAQENWFQSIEEINHYRSPSFTNVFHTL